MKLLFLFLILSGCVSSSGVLKLGPDKYMVSRGATSGLQGIDKMKSDNIKDATAYCAKEGKEFEMTKTVDELGRFGVPPRNEIEFTCK